MKHKHEDLVKAVKELNEKIVDEENPIVANTGQEMIEEILEVSSLIDGDEGVSDATMKLIAGLKKNKLRRSDKKTETKKADPKPSKGSKGKGKAKPKEKPKGKAKGGKSTTTTKPKKATKTRGKTRVQGIYHVVTRSKKGKSYLDMVDEIHGFLEGASTKASIAGSLRFSLSVLKEFGIVENKEGKYYYTG